MLMLSALSKFKLVDKSGQTARLADLAVTLENADYPPVTHVFYRNETRETVALAWRAADSIVQSKRQILVDDLTAGEVMGEDDLIKKVLLRRDVEDAIILDLQNRRATRANDLWLEREDDNLILRGADATSQAILRRLSGGRWGKARKINMYDWKYVEFLRGDAEAVRRGAVYQSRIARLPPGEIAAFIDAIPYLHATELIVLLPEAVAARVFEVVTPEKQLQIFEELDDRRSIKILSLIAPESAAKLIKQLAPANAKKFLESLPKANSAQIIELLAYPDGTVGSIMTNDVVYVRSSLTVGEAREQLCERLLEPNFVYLIYAVEDEESRRLNGILSLRNIVVAKAEEKISDIMDAYVTVLHPLETAADAAFRVIDSHMAAMPVINHNGRLLGVLTIDAAVSTVAPRGWRDIAPRVFS